MKLQAKMPLLPKVSYNKILDGLTDFEEDLVAWGLHKAHDRVAGYVRDIRSLIEATRRQSWEPLGRIPDHEQLVWSLAEGSELAEIHSGLKGYDAEVLTRLYKSVLKGPRKPSEESPRSSKARNDTFELNLGSKLRRAGIEIRLGEQADLWFKLPATRSWVVVECKRVLSPKTLRERIEEARGQLRDRLDNAAEEAIGMVAISATKLINAGEKWLVVKSGDQLEQRLVNDLNALHNEFAADYDSLPDLRIVGMIWHIRTPAWIKDENIVSSAQQQYVTISGPAIQTAFPISREKELVRVLRTLDE